MPKIAVTMFDVYEIKPDLISQTGRPMKGFDDTANLAVRKHRIITRQPQSAVKQGMMIEDLRFRAILGVRAAVAPRVCKLQTDYQPFIRARRLPVFDHQYFAQARKIIARILFD